MFPLLQTVRFVVHCFTLRYSSYLRCLTFQEAAVVMEELEVVDCSEDPLEGVSIWRFSFSTLEGMYNSGLTENYTSYSLGEQSRSYHVVLLDVPPT